jgi:ribosome maturation factor RimP
MSLMDKEGLADSLNILLAEYLDQRGFVLVEMACRHEQGGMALRLLADRLEGGITLDDCASLNREIGSLLDERGLILGGYILEISSPGLDRPLKSVGDFRRNLKGEAKFFLSAPVEGRIEWDGQIESVNEQSVFIKSKDKAVEVPLCRINKAKLIV